MRIDGTDVRDYSLHSLREGIAVVLQKNTLFSGTIAENLRWGNEQASMEELQRACRIAHAEEFIRSFPKILILDDSTSAVDMATDAGIRRALREESDDTTKIIIAQRVSSIIDADQIVVMNDGGVEDVGTSAELLKRCRTYQEIYFSQKGKEDERR